jgi:hypothetical protein
MRTFFNTLYAYRSCTRQMILPKKFRNRFRLEAGALHRHTIPKQLVRFSLPVPPWTIMETCSRAARKPACLAKVTQKLIGYQ